MIFFQSNNTPNKVTNPEINNNSDIGCWGLVSSLEFFLLHFWMNCTFSLVWSFYISQNVQKWTLKSEKENITNEMQNAHGLRRCGFLFKSHHPSIRIGFLSHVITWPSCYCCVPLLKNVTKHSFNRSSFSCSLDKIFILIRKCWHCGTIWIIKAVMKAIWMERKYNIVWC